MSSVSVSPHPLLERFLRWPLAAQWATLVLPLAPALWVLADPALLFTAKHARLYDVVPLSLGAWLVLWFGWLRLTGEALWAQAAEGQRKRGQLFRLHTVLVPAYVGGIMLLFFVEVLQPIGFTLFFEPGNALWFFPAHAYVLFAQLQVLLHAARGLQTAKLCQRPPERQVMAAFFLLWLYPVGLPWFLAQARRVLVASQA